MASINSIRVTNEQGNGSAHGFRTPYGWLRAGALTLAVGVALTGGAGVADADATAADSTPASVSGHVQDRGAVNRSANTAFSRRGQAVRAEPGVRVPIFPVWHAWRAGGGIFCLLCHHKA
jgi:hypothetical protein